MDSNGQNFDQTDINWKEEEGLSHTPNLLKYYSSRAEISERQQSKESLSYRNDTMHQRDNSSPPINELKEKVLSAKTAEIMSLKDVLANSEATAEQHNIPKALSASRLTVLTGETPVFQSGRVPGGKQNSNTNKKPPK